MGLFSKRKPALPERDVVQGRTYEDQVLDAAVAAAHEGKLQPAVDALAESRDKPEVRALRVRVLGEELVGHAEELLEVARTTDDPDLWLLAGSVFIDEAWAIRGGGRAKTVGEERFKMFYATLRKAVGPLNRAADLLERDAVPFSQLQTVAKGLQADRDQKDAIWREVIARCPTLFPAHSARLQILAKKWGGSHEEMLEFARGSADAAPTGDPLAAMVPLAHFEVMLDRVDEAIEKGNKYKAIGLSAFYFDAKVLADINAAADKWMVAIPRAHPRNLEAHNAFAAAYVQGAEPVRARTHLLGMRDHVHLFPWDYVAPGQVNSREAYLRAVAKYVLKPVKPSH